MPGQIIKAYGASGAFIGGKHLQEMEIERTSPKADEVWINIMYCGVCRSDLHQVDNDWKNTIYPCVPGHEIIGRVQETGSAVTRFRTGDIVGVGSMIDSCGECHSCKSGDEQYCEGPMGFTATCNGYMKPNGSHFNTFGGYSTDIVVKQHFVLSIPKSLDYKRAAPILCAGVTTYSPMKHWAVSKGDRIAVVGLGGLGHMAVMIGKAIEAQVTVITNNEEKRDAGIELGADDILFSDDESMMESASSKFSFILVTIPDPFDINPYVRLLKRDGALVCVGLLGEYKRGTDNNEVAVYRRSIAGSIIGSVAETQEVLEFCAQHNILPETEMISMKNINDAFDKIIKEDVRFRYVIDMQSMKETAME
ncbi:MAG TPA: NAD(P)-dependent alcohol dehydrogenase [Puia sp.]|nr:NAD(P)-dependent alcohol dehydrogenase [Puia sp.]